MRLILSLILSVLVGAAMGGLLFGADMIGFYLILLMPLAVGALVGLATSFPAVPGRIPTFPLLVVALIGFASVRLRVSNRALGWLAPSAFPVYLLHQTAIVMIAFVVVPLDLGIGVKYGLVLIGSIGATVAAYELVVQRVPALWPLFGMKRRVAHRPHTTAGAARRLAS